MQLYTFDMDLITLKPSSEVRWSKEVDRRKKNIIKQKLSDANFSMESHFDASSELQNIRILHDFHFETKFQEAMGAYISGEWAEAKDRFDDCLSIKP